MTGLKTAKDKKTKYTIRVRTWGPDYADPQRSQQIPILLNVPRTESDRKPIKRLFKQHSRKNIPKSGS